MEWVNTIVQGVLLGGLYAMFAAGLSLIFGVMRLVNIAHGDLIVLAAYVALVTTEALGINPLLSLVIVVPLMAAVGYALQRAILNRTLGDDLLPPLLVTFGLSVIIQNGLLEFFTADSRKLNAGNIEIASIHLGGGLAVGAIPLGLAVGLASGRPSFAVRKEAKGHGVGGRMAGPVVPTDHVLVVEDTATSGGSIIEAIDALEEFHPLADNNEASETQNLRRIAKIESPAGPLSVAKSSAKRPTSFCGSGSRFS